MIDTSKRRPLASRQTRWANRAARLLADAGVTPNQISAAGMVAAMVAGMCFVLVPQAGPLGRAALLLLAALFCQLRLVCNLLDGMVAVEGGKGAPDGPFWNEFPDRVSDILILAGAGIAAGLPALGWAAAALAVLTAYVRSLGAAQGLSNHFDGPMAKPRRMWLLMLGCLLSLLEPALLVPMGLPRGSVLGVVLGVIALGSLATVVIRLQLIGSDLRTRAAGAEGVPGAAPGGQEC